MIINAYIHTYTGMMIEEKKVAYEKREDMNTVTLCILAVPHMKKLILLAFVHSRKISLIVAHRHTFNFQELFWTLILPVTICLRICVRFSSSILCIGYVPRLGAAAGGLHHSYNVGYEPCLWSTPQKHQILNPLSKARDQTHILMGSSGVC